MEVSLAVDRARPTAAVTVPVNFHRQVGALLPEDHLSDLTNFFFEIREEKKILSSEHLRQFLNQVGQKNNLRLTADFFENLASEFFPHLIFLGKVWKKISFKKKSEKKSAVDETP